MTLVNITVSNEMRSLQKCPMMLIIPNVFIFTSNTNFNPLNKFRTELFLRQKKMNMYNSYFFTQQINCADNIFL